MELTAEEGRVLGCLVEKQLTTPQQYPMTENALLVACNQSTSRDPVVTYDTATVRLAVRSLREQGLLRTVHRTGERSDKHQHALEAALGLPPDQITVLAVLLLRGPQTAAELRARTERMHAFASAADVEQALAALAGLAEPLVVRLQRQPGQKEARYAQLLVPAGTPAPPAAVDGGLRSDWVSDPVGPPPPPPPAPVTARTAAAGAPAVPPAVPPADPVAELAGEVALLRAEVAALRARVDALSSE